MIGEAGRLDGGNKRAFGLALAAVLWLSSAATPVEAGDSTKVVLFFGDSLTSGYGIGQKQAYPALLQTRVDSLGWDVEMVNSGLSGETSSAGLGRIDWVLRRRIDVFVLELGANDGLRGHPLEHTEKTLQQILDRVRATYPEAAQVVAGMQLPPNLGPYAEDFRAIYPRLAERNDAVLIPFLLEGVGGVPELMRGDGIHPTAEGQRVVADVVWKYLEPVLAELLDNEVSVGLPQDLERRGSVDAATAGQADADGQQGDADERDQ